MAESNINLLLIEDSPTDALLVRDALSEASASQFNLTHVSELRQGLKLLQEKSFDAVLLDLGLPDSQGLNTFLTLREHATEVPVVVLTGLSDETLAVQALQNGAQDYLYKNQLVAENVLARAVCYAVERKRFEQALWEKNIELEKANKVKDNFLASLSHELRTPLIAILGFAGTLLMKLPGALTPDQEQQLGTIQTSAKHLLLLLNNLLDLARIASGKVELYLEPVSCASVLEEIAATFRAQAQTKSLAFSMAQLPHDHMVQADQRVLVQILTNLTSNAIKFTDSGEVHLELTHRIEDGRSLTIMSVSDTGIGIRAEDQQRLFAAFSQIDVVNVRRHLGSGLGLYLGQQLASLLGGRITLRSEYGKGSTFSLELPEQA